MYYQSIFFNRINQKTYWSGNLNCFLKFKSLKQQLKFKELKYEYKEPQKQIKKSDILHDRFYLPTLVDFEKSFKPSNLHL